MLVFAGTMMTVVALFLLMSRSRMAMLLVIIFLLFVAGGFWGYLLMT